MEKDYNYTITIMALSRDSSLSAVVAHFKDLGMEEVAKAFQGKHLFYFKRYFFYLVYLVNFVRVVRHIALATVCLSFHYSPKVMKLWTCS